MPNPVVALRTSSSTVPVPGRVIPDIDGNELDPQRPGTSWAQPTQVGNAQGTRPPKLTLTEQERALCEKIRDTEAPEAIRLVALLKGALHRAPTPEARADALAIREQALRERYAHGSVPGTLLVNVVNGVLGKAALGTVMGAAPAVGTAMALGQVAQAMYQRTLPSMSTVLATLGPVLPALRSFEQVEALIQSLPAVLRDQLQQLHDWVQQTDDALTPEFDLRQLGPALAVAAVLWHLQSRLPSPSQQLEGIGRFVADLPNLWQRLAGLNRMGGQLLAPAAPAADLPDSTHVKMSQAEKQERIVHKRWFDQQHLQNGTDTAEPPISALHRAPGAEPATQDDIAFTDAARAPGQPHRGGAIAEPPPLDHATSSAISRLTGWWTQLACLVGGSAAAGFAQVPLQEGIEMTVMGSPEDTGLSEVTVETPLVEKAVPVAGGLATRMGGLVRRHPFVALATATTTLGGLIAGYLSTRPSATDAPSSGDLAERLVNEVVAIDGVWGTGVDLLLGTPTLPGHTRRRRDLSTQAVTGLPATSTGFPRPSAEAMQQLGISDAQRDQLLADAGLTDDLRSLQAWALAVAQDVATQPNWGWVGGLAASEQELLVTQLHALRALVPTLETLQSQPQTLLDEALQRAGYSAGGVGITVDLGSAVVAGVTVPQQMPLLEFCLLRADGSRPTATFLRDGHPLSTTEQAQLVDFLAGSDCQGLGDAVRQHAESLRPDLIAALTSRLVIDAIKAKSQGTLGSGNVQLRGAEIVLGFLQGKADVESAPFTYTDQLADGTRISFRIPNYLVLRSASDDPGLRGQVVLYRTDLASFQTFGDESAFRQFLDAQRASAGVAVVDGAFDPTLIKDIIAAAPPARRAQIKERVGRWEQGQVQFQTGKHGPDAWNAPDSFVLDFKPCTTPGYSMNDWAGVLVEHARTQQQHQLGVNQLRWTPLGLAHVAVDDDYARHLHDDLQTLTQHAHANVTTAMVGALRLADFKGDLTGFNPDHVMLKHVGQYMSLTEWAVSGWQQADISPPALPINIGALPDVGAGLPAQPMPLDPWPSTEDLYAMDFTAFTPGPAGTRTVDTTLTQKLLDEDTRRTLCNVLNDFANTNTLGDAYIAHLKKLATATDSAFHTVVADQMRVHTLWMIELAHQNGELDKATYEALKTAHGRLELASDKTSSMKGITLRGHPVNGVWALHAKGKHYVFLPGTAAGDQLLEEKAFRRWLERSEGETYIKARAAKRYHPDLEAMFREATTRKGIQLGFEKTDGPAELASRYIAARIDDVDEMTISQPERLADMLRIAGAVVTMLSCTLATGGLGAGVCALTTIPFVGDAILRGIDLLERGDLDGAIEEIGSGVVDAVDVLNLASIPTVLYQVGRRAFASVGDATAALGLWRRQAQAFAPDGRVNDAFAVSRQSLSDTGLPMLERPLPGGGTEYQQGTQTYLRQGDQFVASYTVPGEETPRLRMPESNEVGPPVQHHQGQWQRSENPGNSFKPTTRRPPGALGTTTPLPPAVAHVWVQKLPDARSLPVEKLDELETVFGIRKPGITPSPDLRQKVRDLAMEDRVNQIIKEPSSLGLPGDEAVIMRAWADSAVLGNGKSVETYTQELGEWTRGARFGQGPVGMMVEVDSPRRLPTLEALIDAADQNALMQRLQLPADSSAAALHDAVRAELVRTIAVNPAQSLQSWQRWSNVQHRLPTAADNLIKHFPALTKLEAETLTASDPRLAQQSLSWVFPSETANKVADVIAKRQTREQRESILKGKFDSPSKVQELGIHLESLLPGRSWRVSSDSTGNGIVLSFQHPDNKENSVARSLTFTRSGGYERPNTLGGNIPVSSWEEGIYDQLSPVGKKNLPTARDLRTSVMEHMKDTPLASACALPKRLGKRVVERSPDCNPPPSFQLSGEDVAQRDALGTQLQQTRAPMAEKHHQLSQEQTEFKALAKEFKRCKDNQLTMDPEELARFRELEKKNFAELNGFEIMNFATYQLQGLTYQGKPVALPDTFPLRGTSASGEPRPSLGGEDLLDGVPVRRVLIPEEEARDHPTFSGWYREDYAVGADLGPVLGGRYVEKNQASAKIVLEEKDLRVTHPGTKKKVAIDTLTDEEILKLGTTSYAPDFRKYIGDAKLHPANARLLKPGEYRMYQIRSCSEGKILDNWFDAMSSVIPEITPTLRGKAPGPIPSVGGRFDIFSEMNPCAVSCERRLKELKNMFPNMKIMVFYLHDDNAARRDWFNERKLDRIVDRFRVEWEAADVPDDVMRVQAKSKLLDPEVAHWLEADIRKRPLEEPVARVWTPEDDNAF
jgi:hypothetical protein